MHQTLDLHILTLCAFSLSDGFQEGKGEGMESYLPLLRLLLLRNRQLCRLPVGFSCCPVHPSPGASPIAKSPPGRGRGAEVVFPPLFSEYTTGCGAAPLGSYGTGLCLPWQRLLGEGSYLGTSCKLALRAGTPLTPVPPVALLGFKLPLFVWPSATCIAELCCRNLFVYHQMKNYS